MDVMDVVVYGLAAVVGTVAVVMVATTVWRRLRRPSRFLRQRSPTDRRQRRVPVVWERRRTARRLEDLARGFVAGIEHRGRVRRAVAGRRSLSTR